MFQATGLSAAPADCRHGAGRHPAGGGGGGGAAAGGAGRHSPLRLQVRPIIIYNI